MNVFKISSSKFLSSEIFKAYLNFADLDGLLILISFSDGRIGFFSFNFKIFFFFLFSGRYLEMLLFSESNLKKVLIILSSREWKETKIKIPFFSKIFTELINPLINSDISLLTNILRAWKIFVELWRYWIYYLFQRI